MNILEKIRRFKIKETALREKEFPQRALEQSPLYRRECISLAASLQKPGVSGIIAEFKRKSPSRGTLNPEVSVQQIVSGYARAGASACSILTDTEFFGGSLNDILEARQATNLPLLRKDFILNPYQVHESKAAGADAILLIASLLSNRDIHDLATLANELGMEALLEIYNRSELEKISPATRLIGVNNRDLRTFRVNLENSLSLAQYIPDQYVRISESGISNNEAIRKLKQSGYQGFLIGEFFMTSPDPAAACTRLILNTEHD